MTSTDYYLPSEYASKIGLTVLLFLLPVVLVIKAWTRSHGPLEASMRCQRVISSLYLIYMCTKHIDPLYLHAHSLNASHPPEEGERDDVFIIMHAWLLVAGVNLSSVLISFLFDKNRPQTRLMCSVHLALLERLVSVFWLQNPSCFGRILTDAVTGLFASVTNVHAMLGTSNGILTRIVWWIRTTVAAFLVSQMIVYITRNRTQTADVYFGGWQILTVIIGWSLGFIQEDIYIKEA